MTTTLYRNGSVYSPADPFATAMVVEDERIGWVGAEGAAASQADSVDDVIDLDGALVTAAFVDAHVHLTETGLAREGVDLSTAGSLADALDRVRTHARLHPGQAVLGFGWDDSSWPEGRPPTRTELDEAGGGVAVYLTRRDGYTAATSSAVLSGVRDLAAADGYAEHGALQRDALHQARAAVWAGLPAARLDAARRSVLAEFAALGVGAVHEMGAPGHPGADDLAALVALGAEDGVPDVVGYWAELHGVAPARTLGAAGAAGDLNIDGSLGSRSALLEAAYADAPGELGSRWVDLDAATEHVVACTEAGLQAGFHCIGDAAVRIAVSAVAAAAQRCGLPAVVSARHRLEHVEMVSDDLVAELARLGIVASVQPRFDELWGGPGGMYAQRLGASRASAMNPFAAMARAGVIIALGSDTPVTPMGGWEMVRAAAFHHVPEQRLSVRAAFSAATRGGWRAARVDDAGVLAPGALASFAVWDVPGALVVQAADPSASAWSTDPRSGFPGLPELGPDTELPTCLRTVVRGATAFDRLP